MSKQSRNSSSSSVRTDRVREAVEYLLHNSGSSERTFISDRIATIKRDIDEINNKRRLLKIAKEDLEDALEALPQTVLAENELAETLFRLTIDEISEKIASLRPNGLLEEKAQLQRKLNFLAARSRGAECLMRTLEGKRNG